MNVHILKTGNKFFCGLTRDGMRSFITVEVWKSGQLKPVGKTQICPFCKAAYDPLLQPGTAI